MSSSPATSPSPARASRISRPGSPAPATTSMIRSSPAPYISATAPISSSAVCLARTSGNDSSREVSSCTRATSRSGSGGAAGRLGDGGHQARAVGVCTTLRTLPSPGYMCTPQGRHGSKERTARMMSMPLKFSGPFSSKIGVFCTASS